ncbi:hypothetical protein JHK84_027249 [Glycine max]|nr:hypothetical protein JHK86_027144 [Glycine max]KAG5150777.1 hypothetical protein JHK84_027249 [Glycine max]
MAQRNQTNLLQRHHILSNLLLITHVYLLLTIIFYSLSSEQESTTFREATKHRCWQEAMKFEIQALVRNQTWDIVQTPLHVRPIGCKWVYKIKRGSDGSVECYKACLVAKGYSQIDGIDYLDIFSPVVKMRTIRVFLAIASISHWHLHNLMLVTLFYMGISTRRCI